MKRLEIVLQRCFVGASGAKVKAAGSGSSYRLAARPSRDVH